ncbi:TATA element modulatory factor-like isoform X3 [Acropora muricata]|uniref:TATA element modulatory factor-like isoform X3 n=1 Tax=Acropora muricata TaxID=159855 RepID=UPI0034E56B58
MSWFDTTSFSSFAKTALSQAHNLQKSIDRVLDIEDDKKDAVSKLSSDLSKPVSQPVTSESTNESAAARKSSPSSTKTVSSRKLPSDDNNSAEGNTFWSSFLGDSFSSESSNRVSNVSSRRSSERKYSHRASGTVTEGKRRGSSGVKQTTENVDATKDSKATLPIPASTEQKCDDVDIEKNSKLQSNFAASSASLCQERDTEDGTPRIKPIFDASKISDVDEDNSQKLSYDTQGLSAAAQRNNHELESSEEAKGRHESEGALLNFPSNENVVATNSEHINSKNFSDKNGVGTITFEDQPIIKSREQHQTPPQVHTAMTSTVEQTLESENALEKQLREGKITGSFDISQNQQGSVGYVTVDVESAGSLSVISHDTEVVIELDDQQRPPKDMPLASSTPNCHYNKWSGEVSEFVEIDSNDTWLQHQKELNTVNSKSLKDTKKNSTMTVDETAAVEETLSAVEHSEGVKEWEIKEEMCCPGNTEVLNEIEENQCNLEKKSTEGMDQLKKKINELQSEVASLQHVVEVRENKLLQLSKQNVDLQETANILRGQLEQAEMAFKTDDQEIEEVRKEFTVRVSTTEKKFQAAAKERDKFKALLDETERSLNFRNEQQLNEFTSLIKEKDDQIAELLEEGEKLSKQELHVNNTVKKLRAKEKENEAVLKKNSKALEELTSENTRLHEIQKVKEANERKQTEAINKLNSYNEKLEEKVAVLNSELDDANEKLRSMQAALDNAYNFVLLHISRQLTDLHKENASKDSAAQEAALSAEMTAKEGLRIAMERKEKQFEKEIETLEFQISDLQTSLHRNEQQANRREDNLRQEISDVQQRLQEAEARNQELTESVTHATRPLLRQIENLQSSYGNQTQTWERVERNLTERLNEARVQLAEAHEKERVATEHAQELNSRLTAVESQLVTYRQEKSRLEATLEVERAKLDTAEDTRSREAARAEALEMKYRKMIQDSNMEKALLEQQLDLEKSKMETEKKKFQNALDDKDRILMHQSASLSGVHVSPASGSGVAQDETHESSAHRALWRQNSNSSSVIHELSRGVITGSTAIVERLQAKVKQKDGEIELLQEEIVALQKTRDSLTEELTRLTSRTDNLERNSVLFADLQARYKGLEQRHNAVLQMYGEKAEECEELRMDLEDVKTMYKTQIQDLLGSSR